MRENRVIALEGIDGSGKTTTGKMVAEQTGTRYLYCMDGNPLRRLRRAFDTKPTVVRFLYYLAVPLANYRRVEELRRASDVMVDRTIASTIAYHRAYGLPEKWLRIVPQFLMDQVDTMLYFYVSEEDRLKRVQERQVEAETMTESDKRSLVLGGLIDQEYRKIFPDRTIVVDCGVKTKQEVTDLVIERLYSKRR